MHTETRLSSCSLTHYSKKFLLSLWDFCTKRRVANLTPYLCLITLPVMLTSYSCAPLFFAPLSQKQEYLPYHKLRLLKAVFPSTNPRTHLGLSLNLGSPQSPYLQACVGRPSVLSANRPVHRPSRVTFLNRAITASSCKPLLKFVTWYLPSAG
jgi:hypothetical protein